MQKLIVRWLIPCNVWFRKSKIASALKKTIFAFLISKILLLYHKLIYVWQISTRKSKLCSKFQYVYTLFCFLFNQSNFTTTRIVLKDYQRTSFSILNLKYRLGLTNDKNMSTQQWWRFIVVSVLYYLLELNITTGLQFKNSEIMTVFHILPKNIWS